MTDKGRGAAFETIRKFGNRFGAAKINMLEKMGKRETTETEEMQTEARNVEEIRIHLKDIYKKINRMNKSSAVNCEDGKMVADCFRAYASVLATNGEHPTLAGMFLRLAEWQEYQDDLRTRLDFLLGLQVAEALKDFVKGEVREARYEKKKFDRIRQQYESAGDNLRRLKESKQANPKSIQQAEQDFEMYKQLYQKSAFETLSKLQDVNKTNDFTALEKACDYLDSYYDYFQKGYMWLSEIMPRVNKYREQIQTAKQAFQQLQASRLENMDETGKPKPRVFGVSLEELVAKDNAPVPLVVSKSIDYLNKNGKNPDLSKVEEPHVVTGLLKMFFRELPDPLFPIELYDQFIATHNIPTHQERAEQIKPLVQKLPEINRQTLKQLMGLCANITEHVDKNKMTASNLATVLGPNLLYKRDVNPIMMKTEMERSNTVIETIIDQYAYVFSLTDKTIPRRQTSPTPLLELNLNPSSSPETTSKADSVHQQQHSQQQHSQQQHSQQQHSPHSQQQHSQQQHSPRSQQQHSPHSQPSQHSQHSHPPPPHPPTQAQHVAQTQQQQQQQPHHSPQPRRTQEQPAQQDNWKPVRAPQTEINSRSNPKGGWAKAVAPSQKSDNS